MQNLRNLNFSDCPNFFTEFNKYLCAERNSDVIHEQIVIKNSLEKLIFFEYHYRRLHNITRTANLIKL